MGDPADHVLLELIEPYIRCPIIEAEEQEKYAFRFKDENKKDESFMKKFEGRASSLNLLSIKNADNPKAKAEIFGADKDKYVYMLVLKLES